MNARASKCFANTKWREKLSLGVAVVLVYYLLSLYPNPNSADTSVTIDNIDAWLSYEKDLPEIRDELRDSGFRGIRIVAPSSVKPENTSFVPLIGFRIYESQPLEQLDFKFHAVVVATNLASGEVRVERLFDISGKDPSPKGTFTPTKKALVAKQFDADLASRIPDLFKNGDAISVAVLFYDERSNQVRIAQKSNSSLKGNADSELSRSLRFSIEGCVINVKEENTRLKNASIVALGRSDPGPWVIPIDWSKQTQNGTYPVTRTIDLCGNKQLRMPPQDYAVWLVTADGLQGGQSFHIRTTRPE